MAVFEGADLLWFQWLANTHSQENTHTLRKKKPEAVADWDNLLVIEQHQQVILVLGSMDLDCKTPDDY